MLLAPFEDLAQHRVVDVGDGDSLAGEAVDSKILNEVLDQDRLLGHNAVYSGLGFYCGAGGQARRTNFDLAAIAALKKDLLSWCCHFDCSALCQIYSVKRCLD